MQLHDLIFSGGGFENEEHLKNTYFEKSILIRKEKMGLIWYKFHSVWILFSQELAWLMNQFKWVTK